MRNAIIALLLWHMHTFGVGYVRLYEICTFRVEIYAYNMLPCACVFRRNTYVMQAEDVRKWDNWPPIMANACVWRRMCAFM